MLFSEIERGNEMYANDQKVISYLNEDSIISILDAQINVSIVVTRGPISTKNTLMYITYVNKNVELAKKVVDKINEIYLNQSVERNSQQAAASLGFLESRKNEIETL